MKNEVPYRVENIMRKGEIACYKQFLLFSHCFLHSYIYLVPKNVVHQLKPVQSSTIKGGQDTGYKRR